MLNGTVAEQTEPVDFTVHSFFRLEKRKKELCEEMGFF